MLTLLFGGDCHGLNIAIDLILTSVDAMALRDDFVNFIVNSEKINWLIGVTEEIKSSRGCRGFGWLGSPKHRKVVIQTQQPTAAPPVGVCAHTLSRAPATLLLGVDS